MKKQGRKRKEAIVETILECLDEYTHVYVFSMESMRTSIVKGTLYQLRCSGIETLFLTVWLKSRIAPEVSRR